MTSLWLRLTSSLAIVGMLASNGPAAAASPAAATSSAAGINSTGGGTSTWDADLINVEAVSQTGAGVYVAVLDTGLARDWRDTLPQARVAQQLGIGFSQRLDFDTRADRCGFDVSFGDVKRTSWIDSQDLSHGQGVAAVIVGNIFNGRYRGTLPPAYRNSELVIRGLAPDATIIPVKVLDEVRVPALTRCSSGRIPAQRVILGTDATVAAGIQYATELATNGYRPMVINLSLGADALGPSSLAAIDSAVANGVVVVASAGEKGEAGMVYPGAYAPVISVGSAGWVREWLFPGDGPQYLFWGVQQPIGTVPGSGDTPDPVAAGDVYVSGFSSRALASQELDLVAPGSWSRAPGLTRPDSDLPWSAPGVDALTGAAFYYPSATSMAAPHAAAAAALLLQQYPDYDQGDVESALKTAALALPGSGSQAIHDYDHPAIVEWDGDCGGAACDAVGFGLLQVDAALAPTIGGNFLSINDFHGNLEPPAGSSGRIGATNAGGAEYLATHIQNLRAQNPRKTVVVSAGDIIGASPLLSALFHDEPTIEAFNLMGLDFNAVGNHEFDEGAAELMRMQAGGCHPVDGCGDGDDFGGAEFAFLAANVFWTTGPNAGSTLFPAYAIRRIAGVKVAFVGMTLEGTPTIVTPAGVIGLEFRDEADTVNALVPELRAQGVNAIVVLLHEGAAQSVGLSEASINTCTGLSGAVVDIVNRMEPAVDMVLSGHTHTAYNCVVNDKLVTSAASFGRLVTNVSFTLDRATGDFASMAADNVIVTRAVTPAAAITSLIAKYNAVAAPLANRVIGQITADITRTNNAAGESALGDVIADAQLDATSPADLGGAVIALMNPGGIRADLTYASSAIGEGDGNVTFGESFTVQPFGNNLVTMTLTGEQLKTVLEQQFDNPAVGQVRILQVSRGFTYSWSTSAPVGAKVSNMALNGVPIDMATSYRVTVNNFLADGGDNFAGLRAGTDRLGGIVDTDALEDYFVANSPVAPGSQDRITLVP